MSMEAYNPQDNNPNIENQFDVIGALLKEQEIYDQCDEFEQMSRSLYKIDELNAQLEQSPACVALEMEAFGVQMMDSDKILPFNHGDGTVVTVTGIVGLVNCGIVAGAKGYMLHLFDTNVKFVDPNDPSGEMQSVMVIAPIANIRSHRYVPYEDIAA